MFIIFTVDLGTCTIDYACFHPIWNGQVSVHVFLIIKHCNTINIATILEVPRSSPTVFYCYSNSLYWWAVTFERSSLFETKTSFKVYSKCMELVSSENKVMWLCVDLWYDSMKLPIYTTNYNTTQMPTKVEIMFIQCHFIHFSMKQTLIGYRIPMWKTMRNSKAILLATWHQRRVHLCKCLYFIHQCVHSNLWPDTLW